MDSKKDEEPREIQQQDIEKTQRIKIENVKEQTVQGRKKVLCLGLDSTQLAEQGIEVVSDPDDAQIIISNINGFYYAPGQGSYQYRNRDNRRFRRKDNKAGCT